MDDRNSFYMRISDKTDDVLISHHSPKLMIDGQITRTSSDRAIIIPNNHQTEKVVTHQRDRTDLHDKHEHSGSLESDDSPRLSRRKETARRQLLGTIYTKHKNVGRSFAFVAGEKPQVHIRLPRVYSDQMNKHGKERAENNQDLVKYISPPDLSPRIKRKNSKKAKSLIASGQENVKSSPVHRTSSGLENIGSKPVHRTSSGLETVSSNPVHRTNSHKISLPDIIMDFNIDVNMAAWDPHHDIMDSDSERNERIVGASYEEYLKPKQSHNNPYNAKHRPVTPGLLDSLNKLKLPSRVKTERWLKDSLSVQKSYCAGSYKAGNLHNSNLTYPNWIYTDS